ncbi:MAG TPA: SH3 domain-containing protein, partial [Desulfuromonadales bacterium]|nr:SH3 domain-containing protein [Desulfuromonadales bacterium]
MIKKSLLVLAMLLAIPLAGAAETAQVSKNDSLREKPFADAKVLTKLATGQKVDILKREGAWYQIKAAGKTGWVRMLSVRRTGQAAAVSAGSLSQVASGRAGTGKIVATTGVRG